MRFLKTKILKAKQAHDRKCVDKSLSHNIDLKQTEERSKNDIKTEENLQQKHSTLGKGKASSCKNYRNSRIRKAITDTKKTNCNLRPTKNVVLNFGKAIASFATSRLAQPYLCTLFEEEGITQEDFTNFIGDAKNKIGGIESFRSLLLILKEDKLKIMACKKVFGMIAEIFIKYFSANWIIHGRVIHKLTYLKYRFKILRRIQNPELFTYISEGRKKT